MKWNIANIRRRLEPSSGLKRRVMERARKLKAGRKTFGKKRTTTDSYQTIAFGTIGKKEIVIMSMNRSDMNKVKSNLPAAVLSGAACAAIVIGIAAVALRGGESKLIKDNGAAAPAVSDSRAISSSVQENRQEKVGMSVEKMLSMNAAQLRALSNDDYEIVDAASAQCAIFGLKCTAFPEYVFVLQNVDYMDNKPEDTIKVTRGDNVFELGDEIIQLNLYEGAEVGSGVTVGMTYNEIEEQLGHDIEVSMVNTSLGMAAWTDIDGRNWGLHFKLTDEQAEEVWERLKASTADGQTTLDDPGHADLSDINPVCDVAVLNVNRSVPDSASEKVEMSVDKMLSMDGAQLRALSDDEYEIIEGRSAQSASFGLKCAAFPEYVFVLRRVEGFINKPENTVKVPYGDFVYELSDEIEQLNLYEGAEVGSGVKVGMTYNEIEEQLGHDIEVSMVNTSLGLAAWTEIDGRYWALHFDVTDEQTEEIWGRLYASTEDGQTTLDDPGHADLSDMDPVCDVAVFDIYADNWYYGRAPY